MALAAAAAEEVINGGILRTFYVFLIPPLRRAIASSLFFLSLVSLLRFHLLQLIAPDKVGAELKRLVLLAEERGVPVAGCFRHFDERGSGLVDGEGLAEGLSRLGVGISDAAAEVRSACTRLQVSHSSLQFQLFYYRSFRVFFSFSAHNTSVSSWRYTSFSTYNVSL